MHDAFRSVVKIALRSAELPRTAGVPATVLITMTAEQFENRTGLAATSFGQLLSVDRALRIADQAAVAWVVHDSTGGVLNYGTSRRFATEKQSLALIARDQGCAFPGCTDPPEWTEKHHVIPWSEGGPTDLDNLANRQYVPHEVGPQLDAARPVLPARPKLGLWPWCTGVGETRSPSVSRCSAGPSGPFPATKTGLPSIASAWTLMDTTRELSRSARTRARYGRVVLRSISGQWRCGLTCSVTGMAPGW